ncbi:hypothetical protein SLA2020_501460 [Shorea laevis]
MGRPVEERDLYDADHGKKVLNMAPRHERLNILLFKAVAYDKTQGNGILRSFKGLGLPLHIGHRGNFIQKRD